MISDKQKECPGCKAPIPKTWRSHFECGWTQEPGSESISEKKSIPPSSAEKSKSVSELLKESESTIVSILGISESDLKEYLKYDNGYSRLTSTIFIELARRNR